MELKKETIKSFEANHLKLEKGIYISRTDGGIVTVDLRMRAPYKDYLLSNEQMHSLEHTLATKLRNGKYGENVVYVGPMGCQTGFYCLFKGIENNRIFNELKSVFAVLAEGGFSMPGKTKKECGNILTLSETVSQNLAKEYYDVIKDKTGFDSYLE